MNMFEKNKHNDFSSKAPKLMVAESNTKKPVIIVIVAVAVVVLGLAGFITFRNIKANNDVKTKLETASKSMAEKDYDYAILACEDAITIKRKSEDAYVALGDAYIAKAEAMEEEEEEVVEEYRIFKNKIITGLIITLIIINLIITT